MWRAFERAGYATTNKIRPHKTKPLKRKTSSAGRRKSKRKKL